MPLHGLPNLGPEVGAVPEKPCRPIFRILPKVLPDSSGARKVVLDDTERRCLITPVWAMRFDLPKKGAKVLIEHRLNLAYPRYLNKRADALGAFLVVLVYSKKFDQILERTECV